MKQENEGAVPAECTFKIIQTLLGRKRKINNENKQAFGTGVPLPPPFFVKWNPSPNRVNGKKTEQMY